MSCYHNLFRLIWVKWVHKPVNVLGGLWRVIQFRRFSYKTGTTCLPLWWYAASFLVSANLYKTGSEIPLTNSCGDNFDFPPRPFWFTKEHKFRDSELCCPRVGAPIIMFPAQSPPVLLFIIRRAAFSFETEGLRTRFLLVFCRSPSGDGWITWTALNALNLSTDIENPTFGYSL